MRTTASEGSSELAPTPTPRTVSSSMRRSAWRSLAATARAKLDGETAARAPAGAAALAAGAGHVKVGEAEAGGTKAACQRGGSKERQVSFGGGRRSARSYGVCCHPAAVARAALGRRLTPCD